MIFNSEFLDFLTYQLHAKAIHNKPVQNGPSQCPSDELFSLVPSVQSVVMSCTGPGQFNCNLHHGPYYCELNLCLLSLFYFLRLLIYRDRGAVSRLLSSSLPIVALIYRVATYMFLGQGFSV